MRKKLTTLLLTGALVSGLFGIPSAAQPVAATPTSDAAEASGSVADPEAHRHLHQQGTAEEEGSNMFKRSIKKSSQSDNPYTGITYTHADAFDGKQVHYGIDVSKYQSDIDWEKVKADGIDFVFIRVGYRGYGVSGTLAADIRFEEHVTGALAAGLQVGLYYYTEAINTKEAIEEAQYCINQAKDYDITLPIVYDYETTVVNGVKTGRKYNAKLSKSAATKNCQAFCDTVKEAGYTPMVYANKSDLSDLINGALLAQSYKIWLANYTSRTTYAGTYEYWQYSDSGKVDGISGKVDCNYWYTDDSPKDISIEDAAFASVSAKNYTGNDITPKPKLELNGKTLKRDTDYTLSYQNNQEIGTAIITATGIGDYTGIVSTTFKIRPKKVNSFNMKPGTKAITLSWDKVSPATGYKIYRKSTYNGSAYTRVKTLKSNTKTTWTDTGLKANREYFYRIRAYSKKGADTYYSGYVNLDAATLPSSQKASVSKKTSLYEPPTLTGKTLTTIPKKAKITYLGRTYVTSTKKVYHVTYKKGSQTYTGYIPSTVKLVF